MPFLVVKCTSCGKFQVKQQVKANKFSCAVCGQKQSLQRVYAISDTAKQCRLKVQELSMGFGEAKEAREEEGEEDPHFVTSFDAPAPGGSRVGLSGQGDGGGCGAASRKKDQGKRNRPSRRGAAKDGDQGDHSHCHWGRLGQKRERAELEAWGGEIRPSKQGQREQQPQGPPVLPPSSFQPPRFQQQHLVAQQLLHPIPHNTHAARPAATNHMFAPPHQYRAPLTSIPAYSNTSQAGPGSAVTCAAPKGMPQPASAWGSGCGEQGTQGMVGRGTTPGVRQPWLHGGAGVQGAGLAARDAFQDEAGSAASVDGNKGKHAGRAEDGVGGIVGTEGLGVLGGEPARAWRSGTGGSAVSKWRDFLDGSDNDVEKGGKEDEEEEEEEGGFVTAL
ncbi:hypothetical protein DUNSADRAFT_1147 [Dunaliella salina]|uniref:MRN complex-interacting protein N-terminal domain-containing protein n=1 Tax=Dunaliella salina TaxID=3046 RepID=A0ABQ7FXW8_DUNSA|nr:hypothetical protein DUNSADRAFT_1147 [Dunaliella salina]|eukprot:KAF5827197.1 hypothetical protein DUNSADRAFT_1147 [Dunaliella salina]